MQSWRKRPSNRILILFLGSFVLFLFFQYNSRTESQKICDIEQAKYNKETEEIFDFLSEEDELKSDLDEQYVVLFISCNWYDANKVKKIVKIMQRFPKSRVIITGGFGRLSSELAEKLGGEALEIRELLISEFESIGVNSIEVVKRLAIITGLRTTGDNIDFLLQWMDIIGRDDAKGAPMAIVSIEESFLIRRLRASIRGRLIDRENRIGRGSGEKALYISKVYIVNSGTKNIHELAKLHNNQIAVPLFMMSKEMQRLKDYSSPNNNPYLFPASIAFESEKSLQNMEEIWRKLESENEILFNKIATMLGSRKQVLECIAPSFQK